MKKSLLLVAAFLAVFFYIAASPVAADETEAAGKKLGFGFAPGLIPDKDFAGGQLIVGIRQGANANNIIKASSALGAKAVRRIEGAVLLRFPNEEAAKKAVYAMAARGDVRFVERNGIMKIPPKPILPDLEGIKSSFLNTDAGSQYVSSDPGTGYQWHHTVIRKTAALPALSATPPTVAVIDTGVDYTHKDLAGKVILGKNCVDDNFDPFDEHGHGTHVAGIIAAKSGNSAYGEGVCPNCKILAIKVLDASGSGTHFDVACGMEYARTASTTPATRVVNMSLGGQNSSLIETEVANLKAANIALVASAGNSNTTNAYYAYPGADPNTALRVMATTQNDCRAYFSNFSPSGKPTQYNIAAPGWYILSTALQEGFVAMSGTSMSAPVVAGAAALVWGQIPSLTMDDLVARLVNNGKSVSCGFAAATPRLDVQKAITGVPETGIIGRILDPATGQTPSPSAYINTKLYSGSTLLSSDAANKGGLYEMTGLSEGANRTLRAMRKGYMNARIRTGIAIKSSLVSGPFTDALPKARPAGFATITLDWKTTQPFIHTDGCKNACNGWELDLIVGMPDGSYIAPYWNPGYLKMHPYVKSFRDSFDDHEPLETIVISSSAVDGLYKIIAEKHYLDDAYFNPSWQNSQASVQMYNGTASLGTFYAKPSSTCGTFRYWHVGNLTKTGSSYVWQNVNACSDFIP